MGQIAYLLDTNAIIDYLGNKIPDSAIGFMNSVVDSSPNISVISKIELLGFNTTAENQHLLASFVHDISVLELTSSIADRCIEVRRQHRIKLPDAIIAATALVYRLKLVTRNVSDFKNIEGLHVLNPHSPIF